MQNCVNNTGSKSCLGRSSCGGLLALCCLIAVYLVAVPSVQSAERKSRNVFLITTDGLRWQEVFSGAEEMLLSKTNGGVARVDDLRKEFWRPTPEERREALMPFFWKEVARKGQVFGNQAKGSIARVSNGKNFSYPGYSEFLVGYPDSRIDSNSKKPNPNVNVLEWLNGRAAYKGRVAAVCNWDVLSWILNTERSQIPLWTGYELMPGSPAIKAPAAVEAIQANATPLWSGCGLDVFAYETARSYLKETKPRVFYVSFGETDEWAHEGRYDHYLHAAAQFDRFLRGLWATVQSMPEYRDQTTFVITTDHGRGLAPVAWKNHGQAIADSAFIWMAVMGPDTPALGERDNVEMVVQRQVAATLAAFLGEDYRSAFPQAGPVIPDVIGSAAK